MEHPFQNVSFLYEEKRELTETMIKKPKEKLNSLMINLNVKRREVEENYTACKENITKKY